MIEERHPLAVSANSSVDIGICRSVKITAVSEIGWWDTSRMLAQMTAGGGPEASQWDIHFDVDNTAGSCSLVEVEALDGSVTRILLDAGWNPEYMSERFRATGVDRLLESGDISFLFLSHEHFDHFWGVEAVLRLAPEIPILVPGGLRQEGIDWLRGATFAAAGISNRIPHRGPIVRMMSGGIHSLLPGLASVTFDLPILLDIRGEQSLYLNVDEKGLVCITGCCHQGVLNLVDYAAKNLNAGRQPYGLYGGLHITPFAAMTEAQADIIRTLGSYGFQKIAANHCTGAEAIALMRELDYPLVGGTARDGSIGTDHPGNGDVVHF